VLWWMLDTFKSFLVLCSTLREMSAECRWLLVV
jgi:hypothetical protein